MNEGRPITIYDPKTGRELIVYQSPVHHPPAQAHYPPPVYYETQYPEPVPLPSNRRRKRQRGDEGRGRLAGGVFLTFMLSWIPCAFGAPGVTMLSWGIIASYLFYRAVKGT